MSKELEALEIVKNYPFTVYDYSTEKDISTNVARECYQDIETVENGLKALEIIMPYLSVSKGINETHYVKFSNLMVDITKEQYDILREVVDNE